MAVTIGGLVLLFILPGRTWLEQRGAMATAQHRLNLLDRENSALAQRASQLQSAAYVEQIVREQYGLVMPGEQAYGILLPTATTTTSTTTTTVPPG